MAVVAIVLVAALHSPAGILLVRAAGIPFSDPPLGSHCACRGGVCPLDANGRGCSCGCSLKAGALPVQRLNAQSDFACSDDGMAGPYPCRNIDLMAFLPHAEI